MDTEWTLETDRATLKSRDFDGSFDFKQPWTGLKLQREQQPVADHLFACLVPGEPQERWVRGTDLFCRYAPRNSDLVSYHTYYRIAPAADGLDFVLSAQTSLLESAPLTQVTSTFAEGELLARASIDQPSKLVTGPEDYDIGNAPGFFLLRPASFSEISWVVFVHPSDFHRASLRIDPHPSVAFWVFPNALEKGVIRRATFRIRAVDRATDEEQAMAALAEANVETPFLAT